jgi:hypothetical protein
MRTSTARRAAFLFAFRFSGVLSLSVSAGGRVAITREEKAEQSGGYF